MSIQNIVSVTKAKVEAMGGNEQFIGKMHKLAADCGAHTDDEVFDWLTNLGEGLDKQGLQLVSGPGRPQDLYARPRED